MAEMTGRKLRLVGGRVQQRCGGQHGHTDSLNLKERERFMRGEKVRVDVPNENAPHSKRSAALHVGASTLSFGNVRKAGSSAHLNRIQRGGAPYLNHI